MKKTQKLAAVMLLMILAGSLSLSRLAEESTEQVPETAKEAQVASADEMLVPEEVVEDWMVPIYPEELKDGVYDISVRSSSSMFAIESCQLTVENGEMNAVLTMGGKGYLKLFMGTGQEAVDADDEDYIPFAEAEDGSHTFEVPVKALDMGIDCAAFSKKKEKWYDRVLVFESTSLPAEAWKELKMTTVEDLALEDGNYQIAVSLAGGSGRASVESPAEIKVEKGEITARIIFSSKNYDYMLVDGEKYEKVNTEGNSTFLIPVAGFDYNMPAVADTLAMSTPHEIDYTLYFNSETLEKAE